jgi:PleD family two-component response regulator
MSTAQTEPADRVILVVDDMIMSAAALEAVVSETPNITVRLAANGALAWKYLERASAATVCAVITDLDMPVMDGFELIRRIRSSAAHANVPVIAVSGTADDDAPARALEAGANAFFGKPWSAGRMRATLEQLLYGNDRSGA